MITGNTLTLNGKSIGKFTDKLNPMMNNFRMWLKADRFEIVAFYPYTSVVQNRILSQNHNYQTEEHEFLNEFHAEILKQADAMSIPQDNKVAYELKYKIDPSVKDYSISNLFLGYKDNIVSLGLAVWQPDGYRRVLASAFQK